jgi:hypothetical protein
VRTQLKICTETDYLQAHLTVLVGDFRRENPAFHNLKQWAMSILKKWIRAANYNLTARSNDRLGFARLACRNGSGRARIGQW